MIYIGADRYGFKVMQTVERFLKAHKMYYKNVGVTSASEDIKLEELVPRVVSNVAKGKGDLGILSCGTGIGVEMGANRFAGIRACLATSPKLAEWSRVYDKTNVLCLVGWGTKKNETEKILKAWFSAEYDGDRNRLRMFRAFDKWH